MYTVKYEMKNQNKNIAKHNGTMNYKWKRPQMIIDTHNTMEKADLKENDTQRTVMNNTHSNWGQNTKSNMVYWMKIIRRNLLKDNSKRNDNEKHKWSPKVKGTLWEMYEVMQPRG